MNALSSALKNFVPPTPILPATLEDSDTVPDLSISNNHTAVATSPRPQAFCLPKKAPADTSSLVEFDKTICALQKELDSVSQSLVTESTKNSSQSNILDSSGMNNLSIIKRLQENFKETSASQSGKEMDLLKTIQDTIANRVIDKTEDTSIKEEVDIMPSSLAQTVYRQEADSRQTTERLQQLMSSLRSSSPKPSQSNNLLNVLPNSSSLSQIPSLGPINTSSLSSSMLNTNSLNTNSLNTNSLNNVNTALNSTALNSTGLNNTALSNVALNNAALNNAALNNAALNNAALSNAALNNATFNNAALNQLSMSPGSSPGIKSKKNNNPLSMLHLQGSTCSAADQAAILSVLYNERNNSRTS